MTVITAHDDALPPVVARLSADAGIINGTLVFDEVPLACAYFKSSMLTI